MTPLTAPYLPKPEPVWSTDIIGEIGARIVFLAFMLAGIWLVGKATFL